jgi:hypothetical protein
MARALLAVGRAARAPRIIPDTGLGKYAEAVASR